MITFLASLFIKDSKNYKEPSVRQAYGVLSGANPPDLSIFTDKITLLIDA